MSERSHWRSPELGEPREVEVPGGRIRAFERGEGRPIVLVHGVLVNANLWRKVVPELARGNRVVTLDLPLGSHELAMGEDADLTGPGLARIIAAALDRLGLEDAVVVGNDTGGALTQMVATRHPARVGGIVLLSCDAFEHFPPALFSYLKAFKVLPGAAIPVLFASLRMRRLRRIPIAFGWLAKRPIDPDAEDTYVLPVLTEAPIRADLRRALAAFDKSNTLDAAARLGEFEGAALVAWSADDRVFPKADAERLVTCLRDARLEWIEDAYTFSPEDNPDRVAELVGEFAARRQPAAA
jgi:pimeloyl-ACP methyl ester carboxylesterase